MSKIACAIDEVELENEEGREVPGIIATCSKCGHSTESFGTSDKSVKRCLLLMRQECPNRKHNFYVED
jgi:hypothetical protein